MGWIRLHSIDPRARQNTHRLYLFITTSPSPPSVSILNFVLYDVSHFELMTENAMVDVADSNIELARSTFIVLSEMSTTQSVKAPLDIR